jgi:anthranilate synthase component 2
MTLTAVVIDNYDSFTFNLVQYLQELGAQVRTVRNDAKSAAALIGEKPDLFVLSPGPSTPDQAGVSLALTRLAAESGIPLFGVCLGHQTIGQAFGGKVVRAPLPMHGKVAAIMHDGQGVFRGLESPLAATRYHSHVVERATQPKELGVTAWTQDGIIMGLRHNSHLIEGVQFHPESVLTTTGKEMLRTFLAEVQARGGKRAGE